MNLRDRIVLNARLLGAGLQVNLVESTARVGCRSRRTALIGGIENGAAAALRPCVCRGLRRCRAAYLKVERGEVRTRALDPSFSVEARGLFAFITSLLWLIRGIVWDGKDRVRDLLRADLLPQEN